MNKFDNDKEVEDQIAYGAETDLALGVQDAYGKVSEEQVHQTYSSYKKLNYMGNLRESYNWENGEYDNNKNCFLSCVSKLKNELEGKETWEAWVSHIYIHTRKPYAGIVLPYEFFACLKVFKTIATLEAEIDGKSVDGDNGDHGDNNDDDGDGDGDDGTTTNNNNKNNTNTANTATSTSTSTNTDTNINTDTAATSTSTGTSTGTSTTNTNSNTNTTTAATSTSTSISTTNTTTTTATSTTCSRDEWGRLVAAFGEGLTDCVCLRNAKTNYLDECNMYNIQSYVAMAEVDENRTAMYGRAVKRKAKGNIVQPHSKSNSSSNSNSNFNSNSNSYSTLPLIILILILILILIYLQERLCLTSAVVLMLHKVLLLLFFFLSFFCYFYYSFSYS